MVPYLYDYGAVWGECYICLSLMFFLRILKIVSALICFASPGQSNQCKQFLFLLNTMHSQIKTVFRKTFFLFKTRFWGCLQNIFCWKKNIKKYYLVTPFCYWWFENLPWIGVISYTNLKWNIWKSNNEKLNFSKF